MNVDFNDVHYEQGEGPEFNRDAWNSVKNTLGLEFPNLPYFIDGELKLTESLAIIRYIVRKWGQDLNGKTAEEGALSDMAYGVISDIRNPGSM